MTSKGAPDWGIKTQLQTFGQPQHADVYLAIDPASSDALPEGCVVCVVGASRGIGAGIARAYAKAGATGLVLASRRTSGLQATAKECQALHSKINCETVSCDIASSASVAALADHIKSTFGRLDIVIVNSGYSGPVVLKLEDTDPETFQNAINVNYVGTFHCAKYLNPLLLSSPDGLKNFIAVSSLASLIVRGPIANAQYCVSKLAQLKLMEHVHEEYHSQGLKAYSVHPGAVETEMARESAPEEFLPFLRDSEDLCGAFCTWLSKGGEGRDWLAGRLLNGKWDVGELERRREEVVRGNLLKVGLSL